MTTAIPVAGTELWISSVDAEGLPVVPTAISSASPTVVTVDDVSGISEGDLISVDEVGFDELDGKFFAVGTIDTELSTFELVGSDTADSSGTLSATPSMTVYLEGTDVYKVCFSSLSREGGTSESVSVGTSCDPSASIPGTATAGTLTFAGYMDPEEDGYLEIIRANEDRETRIMYIVLPQDKGMIVASGIINTYSEDYTLGQAISWSSGMTLSTNPTYIWP